MQIISRADAKAARLKRYFTGVACRHGHLVERMVCNQQCVECKQSWERRPENRKLGAEWSRAKYASSPVTRQLAVLRGAKPARKLSKAEYERRPEVLRRNVERRYGMYPGQFDAMLADQDGKCAICKTATPGGKGSFHVDHCHATKVVRGLLCHHCNLGLGNFKDSQERLRAAGKYLCQTPMTSTPPISKTAGPLKPLTLIVNNAKPRTDLSVEMSLQNLSALKRKSA